jgi:hypothetical protein
LEICDAIVKGGGGVFEFSTDFATYDDVPYTEMDPAKRKAHMTSELDWMTEAMHKHPDKLQVTFGIGAEVGPFFSKWARKASARPRQCMVQFQTRPQSFHLSHASGKNMFSSSPSYRKARTEADGDNSKLIDILRSPHVRAAILQDMSRFRPTGNQDLIFAQHMDDRGKKIPAWMLTGLHVYPWTRSYEPAADTMIPNVAARIGESVLDTCYDLLLDVDGAHSGVLWRPLFKYSGNSDNIVQSLQNDNLIPGFDDAGAHVTVLTDATSNTTNLAYFGRDINVARRIPLERLVKLQTSDAAVMFNLDDRGVLQPGKRADLNIIDFEKLNVKCPFWANDLPTKAGRWLQYTEGYHATILRGVVTFRNDQHCGIFPGRLVRNPLRASLADCIQVEAANPTDDLGDDADLAKYAVELSRQGGASAVARVMRDQEKDFNETGSRSKL